jgi:hypothetical protein
MGKHEPNLSNHVRKSYSVKDSQKCELNENASFSRQLASVLAKYFGIWTLPKKESH